MNHRYSKYNFIFKVIFINALFILGSKTASWSQNIIYDNAVYVNYIKTVKLHHSANVISFPVIDLNSKYEGKLLLKFDDMEGGYKTYTYKIIHCNKDWYPSNLQEIEFLSGFNNEEIENYDYSTNGYSDYTNYTLSLPNDDLTWTVSGNYLLVVTDDELNVPILSRRFIVTENLVNIQHEIIKPRDVSKIYENQELKLTISYKNLNINQPRQELFTTVLQNDNWNGSLRNLRATYERGESIILDRYDYISFPALKEFRSFDTRTLSYTTEFVNTIDQTDYGTTVLLDLNNIRAERNATFEVDANGQFVIDNERYRNPEVSSEYCDVIFSLESYKKFERDVYAVGAFSDWQAKPEYKMIYDDERKIYLGKAQFKQGYYNYMFAMVNDNGTLDMQSIEGSWFETENDYLVIVYYREFGRDFDRIVAVQRFNSNPTN